MRMSIILLAILSLGACGVGGGGTDDGGPAPVVTTPALTPVTTYHQPSGRIDEEGMVVTATNQRTGVWSRHFDAEGSPVQWRGAYADGAVDQAAPWTEWNVDGSVRIDSTDR